MLLKTWLWHSMGDRNFPRTLRLEISSHCNRSCEYCPNVFAPQGTKLISEEVLSAFLERIKEIKWKGNVDFIFFNEPLLHKGIVDIIRRVKLAAPWCSPVVTTNGDALTLDLAKELVGVGVRKFFAMDHRPHRPGWMERMRALQRIYPNRVEIFNIDELEESSGLYDYGGQVAVNKVRTKNIINGVPACDIHRHLGQIDINGEWLLCCQDFKRSLSFGNILTSSLRTIWNNPEFIKIRKDLLRGQPELSICQKCACFTGRDIAIQAT